MKTLCLVILFLIHTNCIIGQTFISGEPFKLKKYSSLIFAGHDSSSLFYFSTKQNKRKYLLLRFHDKTLKLLDRKAIEFEDPLEIITDAYLAGERLVLYTEKQSRKSELIRAHYVLNCYTLAVLKPWDTMPGKPRKNIRALHTWKIENDILTYNHLGFTYSDFMEYSGLRNFPDAKDAGQVYTRLTIPDTGFVATHIIYNDTSVFYFHKYYASVTLTVGLYNKTINLGNRKILEYEVRPIKDKGWRVFGKYYFRFGSKVSYGFFQAMLDMELNETGKIGFIPLIEGEDLPKNLSNYPNADFFFSRAGCVCEVQCESGNLVWVFNRTWITQERVVRRMYEGTGNWRTDRTMASFANASNINIINFQSSGSVFLSVIPLRQRTHNFRESVSFVCNIKDGHLNFLFFDQMGNVHRDKNDMDVKKCEFDNVFTVLAKCTYDMDNNVLSQKEIFLRRRDFIQFFNLLSFRTNEGWPHCDVVRKNYDSRKIWLLSIKM